MTVGAVSRLLTGHMRVSSLCTVQPGEPTSMSRLGPSGYEVITEPPSAERASSRVGKWKFSQIGSLSGTPLNSSQITQ